MKLLFYLNFHHIMFFTFTKIYASNLKILFVSGITYIISAEHGIFLIWYYWIAQSEFLLVHLLTVVETTWLLRRTMVNKTEGQSQTRRNIYLWYLCSFRGQFCELRIESLYAWICCAKNNFSYLDLVHTS